MVAVRMAWGGPSSHPSSHPARRHPPPRITTNELNTSRTAHTLAPQPALGSEGQTSRIPSNLFRALLGRSIDRFVGGACLPVCCRRCCGCCPPRGRRSDLPPQPPQPTPKPPRPPSSLVVVFPTTPFGFTAQHNSTHELSPICSCCPTSEAEDQNKAPPSFIPCLIVVVCPFDFKRLAGVLASNVDRSWALAFPFGQCGVRGSPASSKGREPLSGWAERARVVPFCQQPVGELFSMDDPKHQAGEGVNGRLATHTRNPHQLHHSSRRATHALNRYVGDARRRRAERTRPKAGAYR